ncbi:MAG: hypothetical protein JNK04_16170 [Myxococcales bacterium]|nr:hypothetical protein [Myxococcales bacterium]
MTDAKPEAVSFYETLGFQALEGVREGLLVSKPLPMFLGIETIATQDRSQQNRTELATQHRLHKAKGRVLS